MESIYIIDAVNYLFRSYYAIGPMTNEKGQSTSALYGFIRSVQKLFRDVSPTHAAIVFDGPDNKKSRREVYADYKMHRKGAPEDLYPQFEWAYEFCEMAGYPVLCVDGVEADDTMASIAQYAKQKGAHVYLCSSDKDLMQLVDTHVSIIHAHKENRLIGPKEVEELYGVKPNQMLDLLAIMGDTSDNIPGLPGFGAKTAAQLLQEFGSLDNLLAHPEKVKGPKKQETLRTEKDLALMSRTLATLDLAVDVPKNESFYRLKKPDLDELTKLYHRMNFKSLLRDLASEEPAPEKKKSAPVEIEYRLIDSDEALKELFEKLSQEKEICIDTETTDERPMRAELVGIGFSFQPGKAFYLPCNGNLGEEKVVFALKEFFLKTKVRVFGHNLKYDWHILRHYGIDLDKISFDTLLASWLLDPQSRRHNLDDLSLQHLHIAKIPIQELLGKGKKQITMRDAPIEKVKEYCCEDADCTCRLKELFSEKLKELELEKLYFDLELPLLPVLAKMERRGIFLDEALLKEQGAKFTQAIAQLKLQIFAAAGEEFNLNSPQQLSKILYEKMGLKPPGRKETETATGAQVLEQLAGENPFVQYILDYRMLEKLRSTYVEALPEAIDPKTGRIHCTFNQSGTATGRLSCQNPNLQNIPIRGVEGKSVRACFKPQKEGWSYLCADYSQIELRLLAHFSEDPELLRAFHNNEDIHRYTAALVFGIPSSEVTSEMRSQAKAVNFGILYGQGAYGLSKQTGLSFREADEFIMRYFERYPRVSDYIESCKEAARKTGSASTLTGRKRALPEITNKNPSIRAMAERLAVNTPLQGTAADLIKTAMIEIERVFEERGYEGGMILQIHDELVFEVPDSEISPIERLVKEKMERAADLRVPLEVAIGIGKNWSEC